LTEHDDVIKSLFRGAPRLGVVLGPASARAGPGGEHNMAVTMALIISAVSPSFAKEDFHGAWGLTDGIKKA